MIRRRTRAGEQAALFRLLERAGLLDESLHYMMDLDLWLRFFAISQPAIVSDILAGYRYHSSAKCLTATNQLLLEELAIHRKISAAQSGEPLALFKTASTNRVLTLCSQLAEKKPAARNLPTGELLRECGQRVFRKTGQLFRSPKE